MKNEKIETIRRAQIKLEIAHLEENWDHLEEWEAEARHEELGKLEEGVKPSTSYFKELHAKNNL